MEAYLFWEFFFFFFGLGVSRLSVPWLFGQVLASFLGFLVFRFPGLLATRLLTAFLSCTACWFLGFLGFLAFRPLGFLASRLLITSCIILFYVILNYFKLYLLIYIHL